MQLKKLSILLLANIGLVLLCAAVMWLASRFVVGDGGLAVLLYIALGVFLYSIFYGVLAYRLCERVTVPALLLFSVLFLFFAVINFPEKDIEGLGIGTLVSLVPPLCAFVSGGISKLVIKAASERNS
jgi:hypothetical protein